MSADGVRKLPMFPLGSVLFPAMPLPLRVFEPRYLDLLAAVLPDEPAEFGVVLIERGQEVGGGDSRFGVGTVAQIVEVESGEGFVVVLALGDRRFEVVEWMPESDATYPVAEVRDLPSLVWDESFSTLRDEAEKVVRTGLSAASEFIELEWSPDVQLDDDPIEAVWQLAAIAPLGQLDQLDLLRSASVEQLLRALIELTPPAVDALKFGYTDLDSLDGETDSDDSDDSDD
ncbi:LON peptidase substrate-binding domain-containing protein [soil metagenome]